MRYMGTGLVMLWTATNFLVVSSTRRTLISLPLSLASSLLMTFLGRRRGKRWITKPRAQLETPLQILVPVEGTLPLQHKIQKGSHVLFKSLVWSSLRFNPALSWDKPELPPYYWDCMPGNKANVCVCEFVCLEHHLPSLVPRLSPLRW